MANNNADAKKDIIYSIALFLFLSAEIVITILALYGGGGIEDEKNQIVFVTSAILGIVGSLGILLLKLLKYLTKEQYVSSILHDPEDSDIPLKSKWTSWIKNPFILGLFFLIPSSLFGLFQVYTNTFYTAVPSRVAQQIQESSQALLSVIPADMEIYLPILFAGILITWIQYLEKKKKIDKSISLLLIYIAVPLFYSLIWLADHVWRYSNSNASTLYVWIFGLICALLLVIFRSLIPVLVIKITNNLYNYLNGAINSDEKITMVTIIINFILLGLWFFIITKKKSKVTA
jgi:hypothetical protein